jgi:drug/metabolite transporter (DMT)-like permease
MLGRKPVAVSGLVVAAAMWGSAATFIKFALDAWGPMTLLVAQLLSANVVLWAVLLIRGYRRPQHVWKVLVLGVLEPGLCYALIIIGLLFTTAANTAILSATESFFVVTLAAVFLRERLTRRSVVGLCVALAGVLALESAGGISGVHVGDALVLAGLLAAGLYVVVARTIADSFDTLTMTAHQFAASLALVLPFALARWAIGAEQVFEPRPLSSWVAALGVGIVGYGGSFLLYNYAIAHVQAGLSSMILNLMPVFGLAAAVTFLGESVGLMGIVGAVLVIASIVIFRGEEELEPEAAEPALDPVET